MDSNLAPQAASVVQDGYAFYGLASPAWNIPATIKFINSLPAPIAICIMDTPWAHSFNPRTDGRVNVNRLMKKCPGKIIALEVQIWWDPNHATNPNAICPLDVLQRRCIAWQTWSLNHPGVQLLISHTCEYDEHDQAQVQARIDCIRKYAPNAIPVNSPMGGSVVTPGDIVEAHGSNTHTFGRQIANFDGASCYDHDIHGWQKTNNGLYRFYWVEEFNGLESGNTATPDKRVNFVSLELLNQIHYMTLPPAAAPDSPLQLIPIAKPNLWKVCAEDEPHNDPRDLRPMLWLENEGSSPVQIVTFDGKHTLGNLIHFSDVRFYAGLAGGIQKWGYEIAQQAKNLTGSPFVAFKANGKFYGLMDAGLRGNFYES